MTDGSPLTQRLAFRLAFLLAVSLVPLGVIAGLQSHALIKEARARSEAALTGATLTAAAEELRAVQRAQGAAAALAKAAPELESDLPTCIRVMREIVEESQLFSFAGIYDADGTMECSSAGRPFTFEPTPERDEAIRSGLPSIRVNTSAPISGTSVMFARHPVFGPDGSVVAFTAVSVPHSQLTLRRNEDLELPPIMLVTFNPAGEVITSSVGIEEARPLLPQNRSLAALAGGRSLTFTDLARDGGERVFSVVPLVPDTLYALGSWPAEALPGSLSWSSLPPWVVPVLMWLVSLGVALLAAERLVVRHIKSLTRSIISFARGDRMLSGLHFENAPVEIREAGQAFDGMRESILRDEAQLEDTVHQKEVLLREVHHRVKNNLQLIASIMNLQARRAMSPEARYLIKRLNERVMSLATIHKSLYQTSGVADVSADELLSDILEQMIKMGTGVDNRFAVETRLEPLRMTPDQAVPLALLVTEALTNALKYAPSEGPTRPTLALSLVMAGPGGAELKISNSRSTTEEKEERPEFEERGSGLGSQLIEAFVRQLGGTSEREEGEHLYTLSVRFPIGALDQAEQRTSDRVVAE